MYEDEPERMYREASKLVALGISVIPTGGGLSPKAKEPHHEALKATGHGSLSRGGERRSTWKVFQDRLPTQDELRAWYLEHRARGLGFVTGRLSGWVVVDVDPEGLPLLAALGWAPHVVSPSGGWFKEAATKRKVKAFPSYTGKRPITRSYSRWASPSASRE